MIDARQLVHEVVTPLGTYQPGIEVYVVGTDRGLPVVCLDPDQHHHRSGCHRVTIPRTWMTRPTTWTPPAPRLWRPVTGRTRRTVR